MDKQILFYSKNYQVGYCSKTKSLSQPQIREINKISTIKKLVLVFALTSLYWLTVFILLPTITEELETRNLILIMGLIYILLAISIRVFLKIKIFFEYSLKCIWYIFFVPVYWFGHIMAMLVVSYSNNDDIAALGWWVVVYYALFFIFIGIVLTLKRSVVIKEEKTYINTPENQKMLNEILKISSNKYAGIVALEIVVLYVLFCFTAQNILMFFVPSLVVAIFQRNIHYMILIKEIAEKYDISLKSKDVIVENDAQAEKELNKKKDITAQENAEEKLNTNSEINTEDKTIEQDDRNADTSTKINAEKKLNTETNTKEDITTDTPLTSTQKQDTPSDK